MTEGRGLEVFFSSLGLSYVSGRKREQPTKILKIDGESVWFMN
jgi:hypothetical protein